MEAWYLIYQMRWFLTYQRRQQFIGDINKWCQRLKDVTDADIRDEFRRAWRIIKNVGRDDKEGLLDPVFDGERKNGLKQAMDMLHGTRTVEVPTTA